MNKMLEKQFLQTYKIRKRKVSQKDLMKILDILIQYFEEVQILDHERDHCAYKYSIHLPERTNKNKDDEEYPTNIGVGWTIKDAILSLLLNDTCFENDIIQEEIQDALNPLYIKIWNFIMS